MLRLFFALVAAAAVSAGAARAGAEPPAKAEKEEEETGAAATSRPPDWLLPKGEDRPAAEVPERPVELFPRHIFGRARFSLPEKGRGRNEKRGGIALGDDKSWKTHAAQVGVMIGGFAALTALCQGGACKLPGFFSSWIPDPFKAKPAPSPQISPPSKYRKAR